MIMKMACMPCDTPLLKDCRLAMGSGLLCSSHGYLTRFPGQP